MTKSVASRRCRGCNIRLPVTAGKPVACPGLFEKARFNFSHKRVEKKQCSENESVKAEKRHDGIKVDDSARLFVFSLFLLSDDAKSEHCRQNGRSFPTARRFGSRLNSEDLNLRLKPVGSEFQSARRLVRLPPESFAGRVNKSSKRKPPDI